MQFPLVRARRFNPRRQSLGGRSRLFARFRSARPATRPSWGWLWLHLYRRGRLIASAVLKAHGFRANAEHRSRTISDLVDVAIGSGPHDSVRNGSGKKRRRRVFGHEAGSIPSTDRNAGCEDAVAYRRSDRIHVVEHPSPILRCTPQRRAKRKLCGTQAAPRVRDGRG